MNVTYGRGGTLRVSPLVSIIVSLQIDISIQCPCLCDLGVLESKNVSLKGGEGAGGEPSSPKG